MADTFKKVGVALAATLVVSAAGYHATAQRESPGGVPPTEAYPDVGGVWTICHGRTQGVTRGMRVTPGQCEVWLREDESAYGRAVGGLVKQPITQAQYDVLTDFTYNKGVHAFATSSLLKRINAGDCWGAADAFLPWDKVCRVAGGRKSCRVVPGLARAAADWRAQFASGCERPAPAQASRPPAANASNAARQRNPSPAPTGAHQG